MRPEDEGQESCERIVESDRISEGSGCSENEHERDEEEEEEEEENDEEERKSVEILDGSDERTSQESVEPDQKSSAESHVQCEEVNDDQENISQPKQVRECHCELSHNSYPTLYQQNPSYHYNIPIFGSFGHQVCLPIAHSCLLVNPLARSPLFVVPIGPSHGQTLAPPQVRQDEQQTYLMPQKSFELGKPEILGQSNEIHQQVTLSDDQLNHQAISLNSVSSFDHQQRPSHFLYLQEHYQPLTGLFWQFNSPEYHCFHYPAPHGFYHFNNPHNEHQFDPNLHPFKDPSNIDRFYYPSLRSYQESPQISSWFHEQRRVFASHLISMLPIETEPTLVHQAYGMDKVWESEFEQLFLQFDHAIVWHLIEVESNPSIRESDSIIGHRGHYLVRPTETSWKESVNRKGTDSDHSHGTSVCGSNVAEQESEQALDSGEDRTEVEGTNRGASSDSLYTTDSSLSELDSHVTGESDQRSSELSPSSGVSSLGENQRHEQLVVEVSSDDSQDTEQTMEESGSDQVEIPFRRNDRKFPLKFRVFIDSAKVRFSCENCGHGWTSMKGRVVFWYELFELKNYFYYDGNENSQLVGFCAYKLFGQQCDICKIDNKFERPMWYPEEVVKVLNNLSCKIGQIYFGYKTPHIDKQRRSGKPKTSHNSSLCQACHDGVCTDRK